MKNFVQPGNNVTVTAPAAVKSGDVVVVGDLVGVAHGDAVSGVDVVLALTGAFTLPKAATDALAIGDPVFWDSGNGVVTATDTGTPVGVAISAAGNPSSTAVVRLHG